MSQQIRGLAEGTLSIEEVENATKSIGGLGAVASVPVSARSDTCSVDEENVKVETFAGKTTTAEMMERVREQRQRVLEEEREKWWSFSRFQFGDRGENEITPPEKYDVSSVSALQPWDSASESENPDAPAPRSRRYIIDYSKWEQWVKNPDDALYLQEEAERKAAEERMRDDAFEKANPGFVAIFNQDKMKREMEQKKREAEAERLKDLGNKLFQKKDFLSALVQYHEALSMFPGLTSALNNIAACHLALKEYDQVIDFATRVLHISKLNDNIDEVMGNASTKALFRRAKAHESCNRMFEAAADITLALSHASNSPELQKFKADLDMRIILEVIESNMAQHIDQSSIVRSLSISLDSLRKYIEKTLVLPDLSNIATIFTPINNALRQIEWHNGHSDTKLDLKSLQKWEKTKSDLLPKLHDADYALALLNKKCSLSLINECVGLLLRTYLDPNFLANDSRNEVLAQTSAILEQVLPLILIYIKSRVNKAEFYAVSGLGGIMDLLSALTFFAASEKDEATKRRYFDSVRFLLEFIIGLLESEDLDNRWAVLSHPLFSRGILDSTDKSQKKYLPLTKTQLGSDADWEHAYGFPRLVQFWIGNNEDNANLLESDRWNRIQIISKLFITLFKLLPDAYPTSLDVDKGVAVESTQFKRRRVTWFLYKLLLPSSTNSTGNVTKLFIDFLGSLPVEIPRITTLLNTVEPFSLFQLVEQLFERKEVTNLFPEMTQPGDRDLSSPFWKTPTGVLLSLVRNMLMSVVLRIKKLPQSDKFFISNLGVKDTFPSSLTNLLAAFYKLVKNAYSHHVMIWDARWHPWILSLVQLSSDHIESLKAYIIPVESFTYSVQLLCWMHRYGEILTAIATNSGIKNLMSILNHSLEQTKLILPKIEPSKCTGNLVQYPTHSMLCKQILQDAIVRMFMGIISKDSPSLPGSQGPLLLSLVDTKHYLLAIFEHIRQATYTLMYPSNDVKSQKAYFRGSALEYSFKLLTVMAMCPGAADKMFDWRVCEMTVETLSCTTYLNQSLPVAKTIGTAIARLSESKQCKDRIRELRGMEILLQLSPKLV